MSDEHFPHLGRNSPLPKKFQEDEDYGIEAIPGGLEIPSIVPQIFKIVGSALSLNSSAVTESTFGFIPAGVSHRLTSVLGALASNILGPGVIPTTTPLPRPPSRRRRRTTTTATPEAVTMALNGTTGDNSTLIGILDIGNSTINSTEMDDGSTTTEALFKESSLGELPVYAAAYAPNYVATTTFPVYANKFLHALYSAPTTTTTPPPTTTDPNAYAVELPFDYLDRPATTPITAPLIINMNHGNGSFPIDYEYEYDHEDAEDRKEKEKEKETENRYRNNLAEPIALTQTQTVQIQKGNLGGKIIWTKEKDGDSYGGSGVNVGLTRNSS